MTSTITLITGEGNVRLYGDNLVLDLRQPTGAEHAAEVLTEDCNVAALAPATDEGDRANVEQGDVDRSALRASSAVELGATNSPDGAAVSASSGRPEGSKRLQVHREPTNAAEPDAGQPKREEVEIERLIERSVTAGETATNSPSAPPAEAAPASPRPPAHAGAADNSHRWSKLRPHCLTPECCAGVGREHCHACKRAMADREAA